MDIDWPPFPPESGLLERAATEDDIAAGRAAFVLRDQAGQLAGTPVRMGMARLGFATIDEERRLGVAVQVEALQQQVMVGLLQAGGAFSIVSAAEFDAAPRFIVFYRQPGFGLVHLEKALATSFTVARKGSVLAIHCEDGPVLFIRHAGDDVVRQEVALLDEASPHAQGLAACDALFEVSFLDLDLVLDEINSLIMVQEVLQESVGGFLYLAWNEHLEAFEER